MSNGHGGPRSGAGRKAGVPNKLTADVKAMLEGALERAGGEDYLLAQAHDNPKSFLSLLGRLLPMQLTGKDGDPLIPAEFDQTKTALALLNLLTGLKAARGEATAAETDPGAPE